MKAHVAPPIYNGHVATPPSKSMAHRTIIYASLANGTSVVKNTAYPQDIKTTIAGMWQLGADIRVEVDRVTVTGTKDFTIENEEVSCCESSSTLCFFIPILSLCNQEITFAGQGRLLQRPQKAYEDLFRAQGLIFRQDAFGITIRECLKSDDIILQGDVSSQLISGLLLTPPLLQENSAIHILPSFESKSCVDLTLQVLKTYDIQASSEDDLTIHIPDDQQYTACDYTTEEDYPQLAFFAALAACNHDPTITGIHYDSRQEDEKVLSILKDFGVYIEEVKNGYHIYENSLYGCRIDPADCPDLGSIPTALAMYSPGNTNIYNAGRLRIKESDRIETMEQELYRLGVDIHSAEDEIFITGNSSYICASELSSHNDHRIVIAPSVTATCSNTSCITDGVQAIQKSYPTFFEDLQSIGGEVELL